MFSPPSQGEVPAEKSPHGRRLLKRKIKSPPGKKRRHETQRAPDAPCMPDLQEKSNVLSFGCKSRGARDGRMDSLRVMPRYAGIRWSWKKR